MNINDMTIGEFKQFSEMFNGGGKQNTSVAKQSIGKYVISRSRSEGLNAGKVIDADETGIVLEDARRIYYHEVPEQGAWYEGIAVYGLSKGHRISNAVKEKIIIEDYSTTLCSDIGEKSIREALTNEG